MFKTSNLIIKKYSEEIPTPSAQTGYSLPIKLSFFTISQGYSGEHSHTIIEQGKTPHKRIHDDRFSLDFQVPIETKVYATQDGTAIHAEHCFTSFYEGFDLKKGMRTPPNFILLEHKKGKHSLYSHLSNEQLVHPGQQIKRGQLIAKTGLSGWIGPIPHLHFETLTFSKREERRSFPVDFYFLEHTKPAIAS